MSAYYVHVSYPSGHSRSVEADTLEELAEAARTELAKPGEFSVTMCGAGAEGGYGDDGSEWWDGLTDEEHDELEAMGAL